MTERALKTVGMLDEEELFRLWNRFKQTGDERAKDALLLHYVQLVKRVVRRMMPKYNGYIEYDDLVNSGILGLIDAVDKFDLKQGVKFETYAIIRIRGEILDHMRAQDWAPSSMRKKLNTIESAYELLESEQGRPPTDERLAEAVNMSVGDVQKMLAKNHLFSVVSFEDALSTGQQAADLAMTEDQTPESILLRSELRRILADAIEELPEKERLVITLYYYEELLLKEIAEILGVTESRVSQVHSKALARMRGRLEKSL
ncbi:MAG: FliA/WhiG family RNA polymerase sigma factor [Clostridiales bacterium]|nr:FliA/WhiG family RNA polymerase sigma factor [Clostridiales bacterium]